MKKKQNNKNRVRLFSRIVNFFDKILILPISKLIYGIRERISLNSGFFERILSKPKALIFFSGLLAFACFLGIDTKVINLVETEATVISGQPIEVIYNEEAYVVEGIPETADIVLMGRSSDLYLATQLTNHKLSLDLSKLGPGTHKVSLKYNNPINSLDYKIDPSTLTIVMYSKISSTKPLTTDILNSDKLADTLVISDIKLDRTEVTIKSYKEKVDLVASVKALIDIDAIDATTAGDYVIENVKLMAYDENGQEIKDVEVVPGNITATVTIKNPSKKVPIKVVPIGDVSSGSAIAEIISTVKEVTVYGDESILEGLNYIEVPINVGGLKDDKKFIENINKPVGVRSLSENVAEITVKLEKETSKDFQDVLLEFENLASGLTASAASENDVKVNVTVKGSSNLLENLNASDIKAYVDLSGLSEGTHSVPVTVTGSDLKLTYISKTQRVNIIIGKQ